MRKRWQTKGPPIELTLPYSVELIVAVSNLLHLPVRTN